MSPSIEICNRALVIFSENPPAMFFAFLIGIFNFFTSIPFTLGYFLPIFIDPPRPENLSIMELRYLNGLLAEIWLSIVLMIIVSVIYVLKAFSQSYNQAIKDMILEASTAVNHQSKIDKIDKIK